MLSFLHSSFPLFIIDILFRIFIIIIFDITV